MLRSMDLTCVERLVLCVILRESTGHDRRSTWTASGRFCTVLTLKLFDTAFMSVCKWLVLLYLISILYISTKLINHKIYSILHYPRKIEAGVVMLADDLSAIKSSLQVRMR